MRHASDGGRAEQATAPIAGTLSTWHDDRGFGFITPAQGGQEIFVHIKAFQGLRERPQIKQRVSFQIELGPQGKKRAVNAEVVRPKPALVAQRRHHSPTQWGTATLFAIPAFVVVLLLGYGLGAPPPWLVWAYLGLSVFTFLAYAIDKSAAQKGAWRVSEQTLHGLSLLGGWPGARIAQQTLRHKSRKEAFQTIYWVTVLAHVAGVSGLLFGQARGWPL